MACPDCLRVRQLALDLARRVVLEAPPEERFLAHIHSDGTALDLAQQFREAFDKAEGSIYDIMGVERPPDHTPPSEQKETPDGEA